MNYAEYLSSWVGKDWTVQFQGTAATGTLHFTPATIEISSDGGPFVVWGRRCEVSKDGLYGMQDDAGQQPFRVRRLETGELSCEFLSSASRQIHESASLNAVLFALLGAAAGISGSRSPVDLLTAWTAALHGSQDAAFRNQAGGNDWLGSSEVWVATDVGSGNQRPGDPPGPHREPRPGPRPIAAAGA
jgi:hypothetical protein